MIWEQSRPIWGIWLKGLNESLGRGETRVVGLCTKIRTSDLLNTKNEV